MNKTVLVNAYVEFNLGDDLFLKLLFERYPKTNFLLIAPSYYLKYTVKYSNVILAPPPKFTKFDLWVNKIIRRISNNAVERRFIKLWKLCFIKYSKSIDAYLLIGGSMFIQNSSKIINVVDRINQLTLKTFFEIPKFIIGANFGPFTDSNFYSFYKFIFSCYDDVCFRDTYSKNLFKDFNNVRYGNDIVFQLKVPIIEKKKRSVGFSLINLDKKNNIKKYKHKFESKICEIISKYVNLNFNVYLFSFCKIEGDEECISDLVKKLPENIRKNIVEVYYNGDVDIFLEKYGSMEIMYTTRFHAMILSMIFKQKFYPLIYSEKISNVLNDLNYSGTLTKIEDMENLNISKVMIDIENNYFEINDNIIEGANLHFLKLDNLLL